MQPAHKNPDRPSAVENSWFYLVDGGIASLATSDEEELVRTFRARQPFAGWIPSSLHTSHPSDSACRMTFHGPILLMS
jgi:hypothetical protein